jgi:hypothetical protein
MFLTNSLQIHWTPLFGRFLKRLRFFFFISKILRSCKQHALFHNTGNTKHPFSKSFLHSPQPFGEIFLTCYLSSFWSWRHKLHVLIPFGNKSWVACEWQQPPLVPRWHLCLLVKEKCMLHLEIQKLLQSQVPAMPSNLTSAQALRSHALQKLPYHVNHSPLNCWRVTASSHWLPHEEAGRSPVLTQLFSKRKASLVLFFR